jgi:hypothetical protein
MIDTHNKSAKSAIVSCPSTQTSQEQQDLDLDSLMKSVIQLAVRHDQAIYKLKYRCRCHKECHGAILRFRDQLVENDGTETSKADMLARFLTDSIAKYNTKFESCRLYVLKVLKHMRMPIPVECDLDQWQPVPGMIRMKDVLESIVAEMKEESEQATEEDTVLVAIPTIEDAAADIKNVQDPDDEFSKAMPAENEQMPEGEEFVAEENEITEETPKLHSTRFTGSARETKQPPQAVKERDLVESTSDKTEGPAADATTIQDHKAECTPEKKKRLLSRFWKRVCHKFRRAFCLGC